MFSLALIFLFSASPALADVPKTAVAKAERVRGTVLFNGKEVHEGDNLLVNGTLETKKRSIVRLHMEVWSSYIMVGPESKMALDLTSPKSADPKRYNLKDGICRWISKMKSSQLKGSHVFTKSAAMGVRGTDFEIINREATGETEVIVFDGEVLLKSNLTDSEVLIKKGQWGGVGGKFGKTVAKVVDLNAEQLEKAKERTKAAAPEKPPVTSTAPDSDSY